MARRFKLINRNLIGSSIANRKRKWQLSINPRRGHPMVSRGGSSTVDYLRRSSARYFSWEGSYPGNYKNFGYLQDDNLDSQGSVEKAVGFNFITPNHGSLAASLLPDGYPDSEQIELALPHAIQYGDNYLRATTDAIFSVVNLDEYTDQFVAALGGSTSTNATDVVYLTISGAAAEWGSAQFAGVSENFKELFNEPFWTNWQAYVLGGDRVLSDDDDTPERQFYGLFGDSDGVYYLDHYYEKNLPPKEEVSVSINYNYYNPFFDEMISNSSISVLDIPNLYVAYSIAHNGQDYLYSGSYGIEAPDRNWDNPSREWVGVEMLSGAVGPELGDTPGIRLEESPSKIPIGQFQIGPQTPNSLLSRFSRKDFSEDMSQVRKLNRHLGFEPGMISSPNSMLTEFSGRQSSYPYSAEIGFPLSGLGDLFDNLGLFKAGTVNEALTFFMFEIMKANMAGFDSGSYDFYQQIDFSAVEKNEDKFKYYGFDWTSPSSNWLPPDNPEAELPYKVNAIDLSNLFNSIFEQLDNPYIYGLSQTTLTYDNPTKYNGFINQTGKPLVALINGSGSIVGQKYFPSPGFVEDEVDYNLFKGIAQNFLLALGDKLNDRVRTYQDILEGESCYGKTLTYKLDKHRVNATTGLPIPEPVQSLYFPNVGGVMNYVDTQVKFGERYLYKAYSYDLVVGNQYRYTKPEVFPPPAQRYPTLLSRIMEFYLEPVNDGADLGIGVPRLGNVSTFMPFEGKEIFISNFVSTDLPAVSIAVQPGNLYRQIDISDPAVGEWFNDSYSPYFDYIDPGEVTLRTRELTNVVTSHSNTIRLINLTRIAYLIEQELGAQWRVRFVEDELSGNARGRFVIAKVSDLIELRDTSAANIDSLLSNILRHGLDTDGPLLLSAAATLNSLFNLSNTNIGMLGVSPRPTKLALLFKAGPHGWAPEFPWDLSRLGEADVEVQNYKSVKILELPYFQTNVFEVVDLPPQFPDVDIIPLKGESKRIKILLNENATKNRYLPIILEDDDEQRFEEIRIGQGREPGEALLFGSDDSIISFQVYRLDTPPTTYRDFAGQRRYTLETVTSTGRSITTASTLDNVKPNVAYYYCFRTIDKNGFISVPSPIIKVQMIDDNGRVYPIVEPYDLPSADTRKAERTFRRYLEIDTSLESKRINGIELDSATSAGSPLSPPAGVSLSGSVWAENTTFKVRVISKDTGRKIDLNLNFNVEGISNPNLQDN